MSASEQFVSRVRDLYRYDAIQGHLGWDQETKMPPKGAGARGEILAWIATQSHNLLTDPKLGELISTLEENDCDSWLTANVKEMRRKFDEASKLPAEFVSEFTKTRSQALVAWKEARENNDFDNFAPYLEKLIQMTNQKIEYLGCDTTPYDVLLDEYEIGMKVEDYDPLFSGLKQRLVPLLHSIMKSETVVPTLPEGIRFSAD